MQPRRPGVGAAFTTQRISTVVFKDHQSETASSRNSIPALRHKQIWHFYYIVQLRFSADFVCQGNDPPTPRQEGVPAWI